ncbi:MAG: 2-polyprenylphenol hydroxylase [Rickettsiales bacterium]|nr:MAG: 2-polyprenylphenol hydroxylase [Rickettsiales bacterium]
MTSLNWGIVFEDLSSLSGLKKLDERFLQYVQSHDSGLRLELLSNRTKALAGYWDKCTYQEKSVRELEYSEFLLNLAPLLDDFIADLFNITEENLALKHQSSEFDIVYECRRKFIQRHALKKYPKEKLDDSDFAVISLKMKELLGQISEQSIAKSVMKWQAEPEKFAPNLDIAAKYCAFMVHKNSSLVLFDVPRRIDDNNHIRSHKIDQLSKDVCLGFDYRDKEQSMPRAMAHAKYCIYCHKQNKDSCSKGIDSSINGCPLGQKISEMNQLKSRGFNIAALSVIVIDNPMIAATGHRICNDCMKACIYQKQDPVNIPLVESNILDQVLCLPWGAEIYALLTQWNPLNLAAPLPKPDSGHNVLVTGLGPAGFALAHYLLKEGHSVAAIDGLKISPLHFDALRPIKYWSDVKLPLSQKSPTGFGGVMEYGITNRWDKNNLSLVRLLLARRKAFRMYGGARLGSNITTKQAFDMGFDHIALCLGAGKPRFMKSADYFAKGVRTASDFLMNLQQGGAYIHGSTSNLLVRMPGVVIGLGLTAIDAATEMLHYYPVQVENFLQKWESKENPEDGLGPEDKAIAHELVTHAKLLRAAKNDAERLKILAGFGGVTICYRKTIKESPAYLLNHEEIEHAKAIGVKFEELMVPGEVKADEYGSASSLSFANGREIKAKSILIAIGTGSSEFQDIDGLDLEGAEIFRRKDNKISYFGDCNQKYAGSVVRALASAKNGYKSISETLNLETKQSLGSRRELCVDALGTQLKSYVKKVNILSDNIVELVVHAPLAAENFKPGQFFKLQNHPKNHLKNQQGNPASEMEPLAITGAHVDKDKGLIWLIILEMGESSRLCRTLQEGEEIVLMASGTATSIAQNKRVLLIGGGLGNAVLAPIAQALLANSCHVTYIAGYKKLKDRFYPERIEQNASKVIWACEEGEASARADDLSIKGNIIAGIEYARKKNLLGGIDQVICIGSDRMMRAVSSQRKRLFGSAEMICSINSPMQCMMKGICGKCIQKTSDARGYIFTCECQDQNSDIIDFDALEKRLAQNSLLEKI